MMRRRCRSSSTTKGLACCCAASSGFWSPPGKAERLSPSLRRKHEGKKTGRLEASLFSDTASQHHGLYVVFCLTARAERHDPSPGLLSFSLSYCLTKIRSLFRAHSGLTQITIFSFSFNFICHNAILQSFNLHVKTFVFSKFSLQLCLRGSFFWVSYRKRAIFHSWFYIFITFLNFNFMDPV